MKGDGNKFFIFYQGTLSRLRTYQLSLMSKFIEFMIRTVPGLSFAQFYTVLKHVNHLIIFSS